LNLDIIDPWLRILRPVGLVLTVVTLLLFSVVFYSSIKTQVT